MLEVVEGRDVEKDRNDSVGARPLFCRPGSR
jgi:hypothetical protein